MAKVPHIALMLLLAGCARGVLDDETTVPAADVAMGPSRLAPAHRRTGPRIPAFSGRKDAGLVRVDDLLWMTAEDAAAYGRGWVRAGTTYAPRAEPQAAVRTPAEAFVLRTDHVELRTNLPWARAIRVAQMAEAHALRFMMTFGDVFDLRLPDGPLLVTVYARRAEFDAALRQFTNTAVGWGAYYDARRATVVLSTEPAARGALPWLADLRHEMTHQMLDLSRPAWKRGRAFPRDWLWLWEGLSLYGETLGDSDGGDTQAARITRFRVRMGRGEHVPLVRLLRLRQTQFEGRHYDQTAALMRVLLDPSRPQMRRGTLRIAADLMRTGSTRLTLESATGFSLAQIERLLFDSYRS